MSKKEPPVRAQPAQSNVFSRIQSYWPSSPPPSKSTSPIISNAKPPPRSLKVKILTWNMHDSLPKGDLEELLGRVPSYSTSNPTADQFPTLSDEDNHPYHLVVIAGQECPTLSGIPMGLGAGFKWHEKDKERLREKEKEIEKSKEKSIDKPKSRKEKDDISREHDHSGWTAMCEDWLCNGGGGARISSPSIADVSTPKPLMRRAPSKEPKRGPYQLLVKERLMGIYMAVYIHRGIHALVRGISKDAVAAGLIGGRVGNKGGVGISLNLDGTTFLFLNAHLAAHGSRINHRLANLAKIKAELTVDHYLPPDDPRVLAEDLTDRFDHTFIFGDLNFRLDITRLHADWLIAHQEYEKALYFDQLQRLMKEGKAFVGFSEGVINFPPTFKYDVLRTIRKTKRTSFKRGNSSQIESPVCTSQEQLDKGKVPGDRDEDAISIASSGSQSSSSADESGETPAITTSILPVDSSIIHSTNRARKRWKSLLSATKLPTYRPRRLSFGGHFINVSRKSLQDTEKSKFPASPERHSLDNRTLQPPIILVNSTQTSFNSEEQVPDKGVYDSSHKQRVPSWCDRILWKTTVQPVPEEEAHAHMSIRSRIGLVQLLTKAFRPKTRSTSQESPLSRTNSTKEASSISSGPPQQVLFSRFVQAPGLATLSHSRSHESLRTLRSKTPELVKGELKRNLRRINSVAGSSSNYPSEGQPPRRSTEGQSSRRLQSRGGVWGFLPSFFSSSTSPDVSNVELVPQEIPPKPPKPRKGDVICLGYNTLDDRGMCRLEGRSDHRPVMGSFTVYL